MSSDPILKPLPVSSLLAIEYSDNVVIGGEILDAGGLMLIVGPTSVGKSYLLLQLAMNLATGTPALGDWPVAHPFKTYLVQAEIGPRRFQDRTRKLWANFPPPSAPTLWLESTFDLKLDTPSGLSAVEAVVERLGIEVLVIDPLRPFHNRNENASDEMQCLFDSFLRLQFRHGVAIIFGHHDRKPAAQLGGKSIYETRGNTIITDRPDTVLRLKPTKTKHTVEAVWEKMRNADDLRPPQKWVGDRATGLFMPTTAPTTTPSLPGSEIVVALLRDAGSLPLADLAHSVAIAGTVSVKAAYAMIENLEQAGVLTKQAGLNKVVTLIGGNRG